MAPLVPLPPFCGRRKGRKREAKGPLLSPPLCSSHAQSFSLRGFAQEKKEWQFRRRTEGGRSPLLAPNPHAMRIQRQRQADAERRHLLKRPLSLSLGKASPPSDTEMRFGRGLWSPNEERRRRSFSLSAIDSRFLPQSFLPSSPQYFPLSSKAPYFLPPLISYPTRRTTIARVESGEAPPLRSSPFLLLLLPKENRRKEEEERGRKLCDKNADALSFPVARRKTLPFPPSSSSLSIARPGRRKSFFPAPPYFPFPQRFFPFTR